VDRVCDRFRVEYDSRTSYHFLLHVAGLSFHRPEGVDRRRATQEQVDARMRQVADEIRAQRTGAEQEGRRLVVMAADEVRIEHEAIIRRAWYRKGEKTTLRVDRTRRSQSYVEFPGQDNGRVGPRGP